MNMYGESDSLPNTFTSGETAIGYPLDRDGPQSRSGCGGEEKILLPLPGMKPRFLGRLGRRLVAILNSYFVYRQKITLLSTFECLNQSL
jgi:hypothetical protein